MRVIEQNGIPNDQVDINMNSTIRIRSYHTLDLFGQLTSILACRGSGGGQEVLKLLCDKTSVFLLYTCVDEWRFIMHIVKLLERRFPKHKGNITVALVLLSLSLVLVGLGFMFLQ